MTMPFAPYVMRDSLVKFGATDYTLQVTSVVLTPDQATQTIKTLKPAGIYNDVDSATWTLSINGPQDHQDAVGLARYLNDNAGDKVVVTFEPVAGGVSGEITVTLKNVAFGGEQGAWATFSVDLPGEGQPVFTDPE
ncbi:phage tail protein [Kribbella jiaozuonensis]|uniref:Uncharacterized protein n=1 Tax=Kribbella jiaozuonensis TaxID=2575441 RepID=A0A4U3M551_9ACTN|nr:hypothetical protein [Kribbella jiaozuonensis]TKK79199.1 hypothetical protein FDA38_12275 [Kribbella jiaozuonensis]TKK83269.1 hypothetical protein FDA38_11230 [Kribbella jiaozuonensis]